jgi:putative membrane protein insertion efficiency factor
LSSTQSHSGWKESSVRTALAFYKRVVSPFLHAAVGGQSACRFEPTCSEYAAIAVAEHGALRGGILSLARLLRCHPLHRGGFDPVPAKRSVAPVQYSGQEIVFSYADRDR